jgi:hypothetical protein
MARLLSAYYQARERAGVNGVAKVRAWVSSLHCNASSIEYVKTGGKRIYVKLHYGEFSSIEKPVAYITLFAYITLCDRDFLAKAFPEDRITPEAWRILRNASADSGLSGIALTDLAR